MKTVAQFNVKIIVRIKLLDYVYDCLTIKYYEENSDCDTGKHDFVLFHNLSPTDSCHSGHLGQFDSHVGFSKMCPFGVS